MVATRSGTDDDGTGGNTTILSVALEALVAVLASAITTAVLMVVVASSTPGTPMCPPAPTIVQKISTAINPYDT